MAAHLLNRAGFGGTPEEIDTLHALGLSGAVHRLVDETGPGESVPSPAWAHPENLQERRQELREMKAGAAPEARDRMKEVRKAENEEVSDLRHWWLERMVATPAPLVEKMTLFWHGHFATSAEKVKNGYWLWLQNDTFRRHALGNYLALTKAISRDPAMMIYLDLQQSRKEHPNENWARELMELFTVGIGNYTEDDIRESARAFVGYRLDNATQEFRMAPKQMDPGWKKFMGRTDVMGGDDVIDVLGKQPACAQFIARKLWRSFVEDEPDPKAVSAVAERLRSSNYEMRPVLREIFSSSEFYAPTAVRTQIKSPVQFLVGTSKQLQAALPPPNVAQNAMRQMGQILFAPPNVKGWDGGKAWVNTSTLLFRYNFASYLINGDPPRPNAIPIRAPIDLNKLIPAALRDRPIELITYLSQRLFNTSPTDAEREMYVRYLADRKSDANDRPIRDLLHLMMSTPQFQLT